MGKRVRVKQQKVPQLRVGKLKDPAETQAKLFGVVIPLILYSGVIGGIQFLGGKGLRPYALDLLIWLLLGLFGVFVASASARKRIIKDYPRSKVSGSQFQEVRLSLNRICRVLDIKKSPEAFVVDSPAVAATVRGLTSPYILVSHRLHQVLAPNEFEALLATMLGHVKARNVFWRSFVSVLRETNAFWKVICAPYTLIAKLMGGYLDASHHSADRVALLVLDGDFHLLSRTLIKLLSYTTDALDDEQRKQLAAFLNRTGMQPTESDVEHSYILGTMLRQIPGLKERLENITSAGNLPAFQEQLAAVRQRCEMLNIPRA
ncbi:MAG: M48 family metalloprotease [Armatimonadetes bacterium]|nr:M48 family metalloprotease [Armatimonadota bacterium]